MTDTGHEVDFDHHDPDFGIDQPAAFAALRDRCPVAHTDRHGGFWVASRYADAKRILSDHDGFTVEIDASGHGGKLIPTAPDAPRIVPGLLDGEAHDRLRDPLRRVFSRRSIEERAAPIARAVAANLIAPLVGRERVDVARSFSLPLTIGTIFGFVGLTLKEVPDRLAFIELLEDAFAIDPEAGADRAALAASAAERFEQASAVIRSAVLARRAAPADDLITLMIAEDTGLTVDDVVSLTLSIVLGGVRTTAASLDNMVVHLDADRELRGALTASPDAIPDAVNELIRLSTVTPLVARTATADADFDGVVIRAGDRVAALLASANRDERRFPDPEQVKLDRRDGLHLAFGNGMHYCLGIWLARMELRVALETILREMPDYEVVAAETERYALVGVNNGFARLTVRPRPAPRT